jgi:hypothetical protein
MMTMTGEAALLMKRSLCLLIFWLPILPAVLWAQPLLRHDLQVVLQPPAHQLQVTDTITLPPSNGESWDFLLHAGLQPRSLTPDVQLVRRELPPPAAAVPLEQYRVSLPAGTRTFTVQYAGTISHPLQQSGAEYTRSFRDTPGTITADGVYLGAATYWYPRTDDAFVTFAVEVQSPPGWEAISQGHRTRREHRPTTTLVRWEAAQPQEQIFLVAGPLTEYQQHTDTVHAMAFLRTPDASLAQQYLEVTGQYITMYSRLLGRYPYEKFALVENFWESGYGMPSFTLLGSTVIRLPFILHSSYPHEILHSWWGNGVFVAETSGNWSEGLTAYLADHLIQEQRDTAAAYRRTTLQKYLDYVAVQRDFPLTAFRARHDAVTEAVGYGKTLMFFHMLRQHVGDERFVQALRDFYRTQQFRPAGFDDLRQTFTAVAGDEMPPLFEQWLTRTGAPDLHLRDAAVRPDDTTYLLTAVVEQVQPGPAYQLRLPLAVTLEGQAQAYETTVSMADKRLEVALRLPARPLRLDVDPQFDLFRRLHRHEIPPALSQIFGAETVLILLPVSAAAGVRQGYEQLAQAWQRSSPGKLEVRWDDTVTALPADRPVWLWGWDNRWRSQFVAALAGYAITVRQDGVQIGDTALERAEHSVVLTARQSHQTQPTLAWLATDNPAALPGLGRKLPHYGKYSYLGFSGDEPVNIVKGQWPVVASPMSILLPQSHGDTTAVAPAPLAPRRPLAALPPVFSAARMQGVIQTLASADMRGRGFGAPELERAADFVAAQFRAAGLQPAGDQDGSYFQTWTARGGAPEREVVLKNVVGVLPSSKPEWATQSVVIGAHYDHLGLGWPDVHQEDAGKIHPGADDNASGVAVLLELAEVLGKTWRPERPVVFVAFAGEEAGRLGSQHYVAHTGRFPVTQSLGMLNLDSVGRLGHNKLVVLGSASAREWPHIFRGVSYVTGVPVELAADDWGGSDQRSFLDAGVPAVQLFSGLHGDYHRPTDTPDKIDTEGLRKVAAVARETIVYLAGRAEPLSAMLATQPGGASARLAAGAGSRRVSLGTLPDFSYQGEGYRISDVTPESPAAQAGLQAGDIIVRLGTTAIADIRALAQALKTLQPGEAITVTVKRGTAEHTVHMQVVAR